MQAIQRELRECAARPQLSFHFRSNLRRASFEGMAFIRYAPEAELVAAECVPDPDHIIQPHAVHPAVMRHHWQLYRALMHGPGPLSRGQRELLAVRISAINKCRY